MGQVRLEKREDWRERLDEEIKKRINTRFVYGEHDCCLAAASCVDAMTGKDFSSHFPRYSGEKEAYELLVSLGGTEGMMEGLAKEWNMEEIQRPFAQSGDVVLYSSRRGPALGIISLVPTTFLVAKKPKGWGVLKRELAIRVWRVA